MSPLNWKSTESTQDGTVWSDEHFLQLLAVEWPRIRATFLLKWIDKHDNVRDELLAPVDMPHAIRKSVTENVEVSMEDKESFLFHLGWHWDSDFVRHGKAFEFPGFLLFYLENGQSCRD
jgi:hypothetical protein